VVKGELTVDDPEAGELRRVFRVEVQVVEYRATIEQINQTAPEGDAEPVPLGDDEEHEYHFYDWLFVGDPLPDEYDTEAWRELNDQAFDVARQAMQAAFEAAKAQGLKTGPLDGEGKRT
jgi:hypothetical protein